MDARLPVLLLGLGALACTGLGGVSDPGVPVSVNPHAAVLPAGSPPLAGLAAIPCTAANAYHVSSDPEVERALAYPSYGKPKILSDDAGGVTVAEAKRWIARACAAGAHYEHWDAALGPAAMSGRRIDSLADFPEDSREVLSYVERESCASRLEPGGTLTRRGTELLWNGRPVSLVGDSWMGSLAGRNFDPAGYLGVLAEHRVNLTRVWVVEQWTGLEVKSPEAPVYGNAVLPFPGDFARGGVDLARPDDVFLDRLRSFVHAASERGIVVQLTLFDRHGLLDQEDSWGRWRGSPYNRAHNTGELFAPGPPGKAPPDFVDLCRPTDARSAPPGCPVQDLHFRFVRALRDAVAGTGNVLFEVMNEPVAEEWGEDRIVAFHRWVAAVAAGDGQDASACFD